MSTFYKILAWVTLIITIGLICTALIPTATTVGGVYNQSARYAPFWLVQSPVGGIGYDTGAGCAVTQLTSRTTGVTCNGASGAVTTNNTSLAAGAEAEFTVTDSAVQIGDTIVASFRSGQTAGTSEVEITAVANGSFNMELTNLNASTADTGTGIINFAIIKAVSR